MVLHTSSAQRPATEEALVEHLKQIVKAGDGPMPIIKVVSGLYKEVPGSKEVINEELGTTVIEMMRRYPRDFVFTEKASKVQSGDVVRWIALEEVAKHCTKEDGWIVVNGDVYDITDFIRTHWGWNSAGKNSTIIAIMSALGSDCTSDFMEVHKTLAMWPTIQAQLSGFWMGKTIVPEDGQNLRVQYRTWDELVEIGRIPRGIMPYQDEVTRKWILPQREAL